MPHLNRLLIAILVALVALPICESRAAPGCYEVRSTWGSTEVCPGAASDSATVGVSQNDQGWTTSADGAGAYLGDSGPVIDLWQIAQDCVVRGMVDDGCRFLAEDINRFAQPAPPPVVVDVATVARNASASLQVPTPVLVVGPDPAANQWGVLAVGLPVWVWADDTGPVSTTVVQDGIQIDMTATRGAISIDWGDGKTSVCNSMTPRPEAIDPLTPSPDCGHSYLVKGDYVIRASASWHVSWQAVGSSGTLGLSSVGEYPLAIREFSAVVVG